MPGETVPEQRFGWSLDRARLTMARKATLVDDQAQMLATARAQKEAHNKTYLPNYESPEEPVIHIGDIHNETPAAQTPPARSGLSPLAAGLIGAGLLATGLGIPAAGYFIADAIRRPAASTSTVVTPGDGNTKYQLRLLP